MGSTLYALKPRERNIYQKKVSPLTTVKTSRTYLGVQLPAALHILTSKLEGQYFAPLVRLPPRDACKVGEFLNSPTESLQVLTLTAPMPGMTGSHIPQSLKM